MHALRKTTPLAVALGLMLALLLGVLAMFGGKPANASHVQPVLKLGNQTCSQLLGPGYTELKVEPVVDGTFSDGTLTVTIDVKDTTAGQVFDFTSNIGVSAVFVKGGPNGNLYSYDPSTTSDTGLHAPAGSSGKWSGLSHISFCYKPTGNVEIIKKADTGAALAGAEFTLYKNNPPLESRGTEDTVTNPVLKCTTDATGKCTITNVAPGEYWLVETVVPSGHEGVADQRITVVGGQTVTKTLVDPRKRGAIQVTKTAKHKDSSSKPNLAATFTVKQGTTTVGTITTDPVTGIGCLGDLPFGSYTVTETSGQPGYKLDPDTETVNVSSKGTCSGTGSEGPAKVAFQNVPLTNITVSAESQVPGGTASKIDCTGLTATPPDTSPTDFNDTSETFRDLVPGTYNCTVVIDP
jgi:hypothetical protein